MDRTHVAIQKAGMGPPGTVPHIQAGSRSERYRAADNHHLPHFAESTVLETGTLPGDANESGE